MGGGGAVAEIGVEGGPLGWRVLNVVLVIMDHDEPVNVVVEECMVKVLIDGQAGGVLEKDGAAVCAPFRPDWYVVEDDAVGLVDNGVAVELVVHFDEREGPGGICLGPLSMGQRLTDFDAEVLENEVPQQGRRTWCLTREAPRQVRDAEAECVDNVVVGVVAGLLMVATRATRPWLRRRALVHCPCLPGRQAVGTKARFRNGCEVVMVWVT